MDKVTSTVTIERSEYDVLTLENEMLKGKLQWFDNQLLALKRRQFGASSETTDVDPSQISLFAEVVPALPEPEAEEITYKRKKQAGKRESDLSGFPIERIEYELTEEERACPECGKTMREVGVDVRRELKLIPAKIVVVERTTHVYTCRDCEDTAEKTPFKRAETPPALIPGSLDLFGNYLRWLSEYFFRQFVTAGSANTLCIGGF